MIALGLEMQTHILFDNKIWATIGKYSYGIYLSHSLIISFYEWTGIQLENPIVNWGIKNIVVLLLSLITAVILNVFVEKPCLKLEKRIRKKFI